MRTVELYSWYIQLLIEAALLWRMRRSEYRVARAFIAFDLAASILNAIVDRFYFSAYVPVWKSTFLIDTALLAMAVIEARAKLLRERAGRVEYLAVVSMLAVASLVAAPWSLRGFFVVRLLVAFAIVASLMITSLWYSTWRWHAACLFAFALIDLYGYLALILPDKLPLRVPQTFLMIGDGLVFAVWAVIAKRPQSR